MTVALVSLCLLAELDAGLPPGLLVSVVAVESGGRSIVARGRGRGHRGCDVGVAQIHVPGCRIRAVRRVLPVRVNLQAATKVLSWSRLRCPGWSGCHGWAWGRYNPGSQAWTRKVRSTWRYLMTGAVPSA